MKILVVNEFESKAPNVKSGNGSQEGLWNSVNQSRGENDHDQILKAKDEINNQLLPGLEKENDFVLFSCCVSVRLLSSYLVLFVLACM